jgi:hypothetical protein
MVLEAGKCKRMDLLVSCESLLKFQLMAVEGQVSRWERSKTLGLGLLYNNSLFLQE